MPDTQPEPEPEPEPEPKPVVEQNPKHTPEWYKRFKANDRS
jgi:hypothetical protein